MSAVLWALVLLPLLSGGLLALAGAVRPATDLLAVPVALVVQAGVVVLAVAAAVGRPAVRAPLLPGADATLAVDGLSALMVVTVAVVALLVLSFSTADVGEDEARSRFFGLVLVFTGAMLLTVTATDLVVLLAAWELMGAMSYALIGFWWHDDERVRSATTACLVTRAADLGQYVAAGAAYAGAGALALSDLPGASAGWRDVVAGGLVVSALGKSAQLPFAFWISRAMAGPSPVSALLHSATMVASGGYLLLRLRPLLDATSWAGPTVAWAGAVTALLLGAVAVAQTDLKQLLAASTSAQLGFVVLAAGTGATAGGAAQLVAHAAVKSALFLAAGAWLTAYGTKALRGLRGVVRRERVLGAASVVALLALAGIPPLSLWLTKDSVLAAAQEQSGALYVVALAAAVLSAGYAGRALAFVAAPGRPRPVADADLEQEPTGAVPGAATVTVALLAVVGAVLGVQALPGVADRYTASFGGTAALPSRGGLALSAALAVAVLVVALRLRGALPRAGSRLWGPLTDWLGLEAAAHAVVLRPTLVLARALARADDRLLDRAVEGTATLAVRAAGTALRGDTRFVDGGVRAVAGAARRLGAAARRPQTGQVHQYYAQVAVALTVLLGLALLIGR